MKQPAGCGPPTRPAGRAGLPSETFKSLPDAGARGTCLICHARATVRGMRGYFGVGVEKISKPLNLGAVMRTAHAFGASFLFTIDATPQVQESRKSDTSSAWARLPFYQAADVASLVLPRECALVGVELLDEAVALPSFRHPSRAAYVLGPERGSLSPALRERCDLLVKIPTQFSINVGIAAAIVMYDRVRSLGAFPPRPVSPGGPIEALPAHHHGDPVLRRQRSHDGCES